jgi:spermidine synthase
MPAFAGMTTANEAFMADKRWLPETLFDDLGFRMTFAVDKVLYEQQTAHQHLVLFEQKHFGKMLMLDGATQVTTRDEFIYHEMMTHVPILAHGARERADHRRRRLRHRRGGAEAQGAEERGAGRDRRVGGRVFEGALSGIHQAGLQGQALRERDRRRMKYVAETERRFDVIIVDSTDPQGPGAVLFTKAFYAACKRCMAAGGVMVTQNGVPFFQPDELVSSVGMFKSLFSDGACYVAAIPTYVGGHMAMGWAAKDRKLRQHPVRTIAARYRKAGSFKTKYWTPEVHVAAFALPRFIAEHVKGAKKR